MRARPAIRREYVKNTSYSTVNFALEYGTLFDRMATIHAPMSPRSPAHQEWISRLPQSEMVYPDSVVLRIKYYFRRVYGPYHPTVRDSIIYLSLIKNRGRQPFLLGTIAPGLSVEDFVAFLVEKGFAYHRVAWEDDGEIVSLRHVENFVYQYHVRIFEDREVRGHYEYTPECYPILHLWDVGRQDRREEFLELVGDRLIPYRDADRSDYNWEFFPGVRSRS